MLDKDHGVLRKNSNFSDEELTFICDIRPNLKTKTQENIEYQINTY